ncbi:MAG: 2-oxo-4-hydroxy-4-carboxy-5-ureidoimidazoline decarboxylase [Pseudonocardiaceae bacterium]|nr:2-oxo-4-hydroxy-4-carboxy-5-ureidoimidazoline decarboxylase [Pseudonocardiaceae bacterium]
MARFNESPRAGAVAEMITFCHCRAWAEGVVDGRPYADVPALTTTAGELIERLDWSGIEEAMSAHPRIGDRVSGADRAARWSLGEQAGVDGSLDALLDGNRRYEARFGQVFLIRASGRDAVEVLAELERRLTNDVASERDEVRDQLAQITIGRLRGAFA